MHEFAQSILKKLYFYTFVVNNHLKFMYLKILYFLLITSSPSLKWNRPDSDKKELQLLWLLQSRPSDLILCELNE